MPSSLVFLVAIVLLFVVISAVLFGVISVVLFLLFHCCGCCICRPGCRVLAHDVCHFCHPLYRV
jgi:hypothetical protein